MSSLHGVLGSVRVRFRQGVLRQGTTKSASNLRIIRPQPRSRLRLLKVFLLLEFGGRVEGTKNIEGKDCRKRCLREDACGVGKIVTSLKLGCRRDRGNH